MSVTKQYTIITEPQKCTSCRRCQLICSFESNGEFNPVKTYITIAEDDQGIIKISFTDDCDMCGACVRYCVFGALKFTQVKGS